jgi:hypothetical protein
MTGCIYLTPACSRPTISTSGRANALELDILTGIAKIMTIRSSKSAMSSGDKSTIFSN